MEVITHDIVVVGGGGAGIRAAIAAAQADPALSVAMVTKVYPMRSHTVAAEGGAAACLKPEEDSLDLHAYDTIKGSDYLADQDVVESFVEQAPREIIQMEHWGCPWSRLPDGRISQRPFGGMSTPRTCHASDRTGFHMLHTLFQTSLKYPNIYRYDEFHVTRLVEKDGRIAGCVARDVRRGKMVAFRARSVILTTGGSARMFGFTTNGHIKTGDGMVMAYRLGVPLKDLEFIQFHPTGLPGTGILITEASRGEGAYLLNSEGERFMKEYAPNKMELGPRDLVSRSIIHEVEAGRGVEGPDGQKVYAHLDFRHMGEAKVNDKLPMVRELALEYLKLDVVSELVPIRPVAHYVMGGIATDIDAHTMLDGLFAAGECACGSINGANRLGSNSLTECLVFGERAGRGAATFAGDHSHVHASTLEQAAVDEERMIQTCYLDHVEGGDRYPTIFHELTAAMDRGCGVYRTEETLRETSEKVAELRDRYRSVRLTDRATIFNTDLMHTIELGFMLEVSQCVVDGALARQESRGGHARADYPTRDDENFLHHSLFYRQEDGSPRLEKGPVGKTKWEPEERKY
jgi:fumarate reductase flavoprotein subunit